MIEIPSLRPETRYGIPMADRFLFNREYIVGYSYLFRQPRFAMEVIDPKNRRVEVKRKDPFRPDIRVPEKFRAELNDYVGSGFDRGHLIASADRRVDVIVNSETFLLTNMSPQKPKFNRGIWKQLEVAVRDLANLYVEVYAVCGPLFDVGKVIKTIGKDPVKVPVPHAYFKSILAEKEKGKLDMWSFIFPNEESKKSLDKFLVPTIEIELRSGLSLWDRIDGASVERMKARKKKLWSLEKAKKAAKKAAVAANAG